MNSEMYDNQISSWLCQLSQEKHIFRARGHQRLAMNLGWFQVTYTKHWIPPLKNQDFRVGSTRELDSFLAVYVPGWDRMVLHHSPLYWKIILYQHTCITTIGSQFAKSNPTKPLSSNINGINVLSKKVQHALSPTETWARGRCARLSKRRQGSREGVTWGRGAWGGAWGCPTGTSSLRPWKWQFRSLPRWNSRPWKISKPFGESDLQSESKSGGSFARGIVGTVVFHCCRTKKLAGKFGFPASIEKEGLILKM